MNAAAHAWGQAPTYPRTVVSDTGHGVQISLTAAKAATISIRWSHFPRTITRSSFRSSPSYRFEVWRGTTSQSRDRVTEHTFTVLRTAATGTTEHPVTLARHGESYGIQVHWGAGFHSSSVLDANFSTDPDPATTPPTEPETPPSGSAFRVPFFSPAQSCIHGASDAERCDNPTVMGFLHVVNYGTSAASVTVTGKDVNGAGGTYTLANHPAGANRRVQDHVLEGSGGFNHNGSGAWSLVVESTSPEIRVAAFSALGNPAAGFTALPVIDANAACP